MQIQTGFAELNGTRLYYEVAGSGAALAFVHGFSLDTRMWDDQFEAFAERYRVVRYDARGFGKSALPGSEKYMHAADLKALLEQLGIDRASVVGLSMGGGIAIDFALTYPEATRALVLVDSTLGGFRSGEPGGRRPAEADRLGLLRLALESRGPRARGAAPGGRAAGRDSRPHARRRRRAGFARPAPNRRGPAPRHP
jgi:pimeloyl-ACP methyl ester carboxylesterase